MTLTTSPEQRAVQLHYQGEPMSRIMVDTGLNRAQILAAVDDDTMVRRPPARPTAPRLQPAASPASTPRPPAPAPAPAPAPPRRPDSHLMSQDEAAASLGMMTPHALLNWADKHPDKRIQAIATRVRDGLDELRTRHAAAEKTREAAAEVQRLEADLEAAMARLRAVTGTPARTARPKPGPEHAAHLAAIRTWATANGHQVALLGRIPQHIVDAYAAAHPEATA